MKYKIIFTYDGSLYYGHAKQIGVKTVQEEVERVISLILHKETTIYASGRTDRGVHALNQVADFTSEEIKDLQKFKHNFNKYVNKDIYLKSIEQADDEFSSRISAKKKTYRYIINIGEYDPLNRNYEIYLNKLDVPSMEKASKLFVGTHNFQNFTSKEEDKDNFVRTVYEFRFKIENGRLIIEVDGNGFMRYQVRKMIGTLIEVGKHTINEDLINEYLSSNTRNIINYTAPSNALYLVEVYY